MTFTLQTSDGQESAIMGTLRIGRGAECEIQIADSLASRVHASVWEDGGRPFVRDEHSSNGTYVNGGPLLPGEPRSLKVGDTLRIGNVKFTIAVGAGPAASPPERPRERVAAAGPLPVADRIPPGVVGRAPASPLAAAAPVPSSRSRLPALAIGGCLALLLLAVCGGLAFFGVTNQPALGTALAPLGRRAPTPSPSPSPSVPVTPGVGTAIPVTPRPVATGATSPAQSSNISVQVVPSAPTGTPLAPAAYAADSQALAGMLAELNQAQLRFIHDATGPAASALTKASLTDDLLSIGAVAFKLATSAEKLVQASAVQAGGSATAGQVAGLYAGLAQYGYAQALDAQNLRLALANGTLDPAGAAARVADFGARAWNPSVTGPATAGNPFVPFTANPAAIPVAAPLSATGAAALQTSLGPQAGLQSWIAAPAQTVTRTVDFPLPLRPLGDPQDPALLASLITAAGQADGDRASQADAAGLQRLGATITRSTGSHSAPKGADMAAQTAQDGLDFMLATGILMTADQKPGGHTLAAFAGGAGAALAKTASTSGGDDAFINNVFGLGKDNAPTKTGSLPITTAAPLVTLSIVNLYVGHVDKSQIAPLDAHAQSNYGVVWQTNLTAPHFKITCNGQTMAADGPSGQLSAQSYDRLPIYPGSLTIYCAAGASDRPLGTTSLTVLVGDPAEATQVIADVETKVAGERQTQAAQAQATKDEAQRRATLTQAVVQTQSALETRQAAAQHVLETEQAATQTAEHIATAQQAAAGTATAQAAGIFTLNGTFNLVQSDAGCQFADAPSTSGTLQMSVNFNTGQATATFTGGGGGTRSLTCNQDTGDMHWQQTYSVDFSGAVDRSSGALTLTGTLTGSNNVSWSNCKHGGDNSTCPSSYAHGYSFPVTLSGTVDQTSHRASGTWQVQKVSLPTSGDWGGG